MSGETKLKEQLEETDSTQKMLDIINEAIAQYKDNLKLSQIAEFDDDIGEWFNADSKTLSGMDPELCATVAHMMLRYHTFLQTHLAHEKVQLKTLNSLIYQWAQGYWGNFPDRQYMSAEMKIYAIAKRYNTALQTPLRLKRFVESRIETVEGMASAAKDHYHFFMNFARMKNV